MFIQYFKNYLVGRKKNKILIDLLKFHNDYRKKYPNLIAPIFDYISSAYSVFGFYEREELECVEKLLKKYCRNKYVIDCGANYGNHTLFFSKFSKGVFSFEPNFLTYECLKLNTTNNKKIKIYNYGLLNKKMKKNFYIVNGNLGASSIFKKKNSNTVVCNFRKLDSFKEILNKKISLIKIDVEDSELKLIEGAKKILSKKPIIFFEVSDLDASDKFYQILKKKYRYNFLYVLKKQDFSKNIMIVNIFNKFIASIKSNSTDNKFKINLANSVRERNGSSHFAILSKYKLIL